MLAAPVPAVRKALTRYRVMAWIVGVMLLLLVTAMLLKYVFKVIDTTAPVAIAHGWLYMIYVLIAFDLCLRMRWNLLRIAFVVLAGTIPFVSFVAEHNVTKWVRAEIAEKEAATAVAAPAEPAADPQP